MGEDAMSHSLIKIWIHGVFSTKDRIPLIKATFEKKLYAHITEHLENDFDCSTRIINGTADHVHILFLMSQNFAIQEIFKNIKGESSHWINSQNIIKDKFAWQVGYGAFSVSESKVKSVEEYIRNQKEHHKKQTFADEYDVFMKKYGLNIVNR